MGESAVHDDRPLKELIRLLGDQDANIRAESRHRLSAKGVEAIPGLLDAIQTVDEDVRFEISRVLTEMGEIAIERMMKAIVHPDVHVRAAAARVLSLTGGEDARRRLDEAAEAEGRKTVRKELREASAKIARRLETLETKHLSHLRQEGTEAPGEKAPTPKEQEEKKLYLSIVRNVILSNWATPRLFPAKVSGEEVLVTLKVDSDGNVSRVLLENKWQNTPLGESLKEAIRRSSPLPPLPEAVTRGKKEIDLTFILPAPS